MTDYGVTPTGFVRKPFTAILADYEARARATLGDDIDLQPHTPFYQMLESVAYESALIWDLLEDLYYSGYVDFATGDSLDHLVALLGIRRKAATRAEGTVLFSRSAAGSIVTIPTGTRVATQDLALVYQTTQTADLTDLSVSVPVIAVDPGAAGNVAPATITRLVDPISGVTSVTNVDATSGGADTETDPELRYRVITYSPSAKGTRYSIVAALTTLEGVQDVALDENFTACTITLTVAGGDDAEIAATLEDTRPAGILATWQRPSPVSVAVTATVSRTPSADAPTVQDGVEAAVTAYLSGLPIGDDVIYSDLVRTVLGVDGVNDIHAMSATAGSTTIQQFGQTLVIPAGQKASPGLISITVV